MIERYTRPELGALWSDEARMTAWRDVEVAACEAMEGPTADELEAIRAATFTVEAVNEREKTTDHDVAAFVDVLSASAGPAGRWIHYGLTSSDVLDTALALQLKRAGEVIVPGAHRLVEALAARAREQRETLCVGRTHGVHAEPTSFGIKLAGSAFEAHRNAQRLERAFAQASVGAISGAHRLVEALAARAREQRETLCVGRTHGVHAEPTSFGIKLAGFAFEAHRNARRLERAFAQASVGAISGAVGTYSATSPAFEQRVLASLGLEREPVSTQVVARDRHAELLQAIALAGAGLERFATELRHLQRTEVREAEEPFRAGQKGSSAMPHKRNPIKSEQISGLARVLRGNAQAAVEDVALWHERDISHSSVERVILPDSTILIDYMQARATALVEGMVVHRARMEENLELTCGALFSQRVLLALIEQAGMVRDDAYRIVQRTAQEAWDTRTPLRSLLAVEPAVRDAGLDLDAIFDYGVYVRHAGEIFARLDEIA